MNSGKIIVNGRLKKQGVTRCRGNSSLYPVIAKIYGLLIKVEMNDITLESFVNNGSAFLNQSTQLDSKDKRRLLSRFYELKSLDEHEIDESHRAKIETYCYFKIRDELLNLICKSNTEPGSIHFSQK